jgi:uncharacterized membrane protein YhiD involved in acid resistance
MLNRTTQLAVLAITATLLSAVLPAHAQRTVEQCASQLKARGYSIQNMDIDDGRIYDYEAFRNNRKYDIKTDMSCKVLLEKLDD